MTLEIVDDQGVIYSGPDEEVLEKWSNMDESMKDVTPKGNVKLVKVIGVWK